LYSIVKELKGPVNTKIKTQVSNLGKSKTYSWGKSIMHCTLSQQYNPISSYQQVNKAQMP